MNPINGDLNLLELPGFSVVQPLGKGGMANVYLAKDLRLNRLVALKHIPIEKNQTKNVLAEARALAKIDHVNVVRIYDVIGTGSGVILVMEYVKGVPWHHARLQQTLSLESKLQQMRQLAEGMAAIHQAGIIHGDLKPQNVMISELGAVKILDFGIAQESHGNQAVNASHATIQYAAPEQLRGKAIGEYSDLFSFGILAYEYVVGYHPFGSPDEILDNIHAGKHKDALKVIPAIQADLALLLNILLSHHHKNRPDSFTDVTLTLKEIQKRVALEGESGAETQVLPTSPTNAVGINKRRTLWGVIVAIVGLGVWGAWSFGGPEPPERYVLVKTPHFSANSNSQDGFGQTLVATIDDALRQSIISQSGLRLLPDTLSDVHPGDIQHSALQNGATDLVLSEISCTEATCEVMTSLLNQTGDGAPWIVTGKRSWLVTSQTPLNIYNATRDNLQQLLPSEDAGNRPFVTGKSYDRYINLYQRFWLEDEFNDELLNDLDQVTRQNPHFASAYSLYRAVGMNLFNESGDKLYLDKLESLLLSAPSEVKSQLAYAVDMFNVAMARRQIEQGKSLLNLAAQRGAGEALIAELTARLFVSTGELDKAAKHYLKAAQFRPSVSNLYGLAYTHYGMGNLAQAEQHLLKVRQLDPSYAPAMELLANTYLLGEQLQLAIEQYLALIETTPHSNYLSNLSVAYTLNRDYLRALEYAQQASDRSPDNVYWMLNLADIKQILGQGESARTLYLKILQRVDSQDAASLAIAAQANAHLGSYQLAIEQVNQAKKLTPENGESAFNAAIVYALASENLSAVSQVKEARKLGISAIWFTLPWFEGLCGQQNFDKMLQDTAQGFDRTYSQLLCSG